MENETDENIVYQIGEAVITEIEDAENIEYTSIKQNKSSFKLKLKGGAEYLLKIEKV